MIYALAFSKEETHLRAFDLGFKTSKQPDSHCRFGFGSPMSSTFHCRKEMLRGMQT